ncbi:MAG: hypothetical protein ABI728_14935, partial [Betaproteobacteria bacterium]
MKLTWSRLRRLLRIRPHLRAIQHGHRARDEAGRIVQVRRNDQRVARLGEFLERADTLYTDSTPGLAIGKPGWHGARKGRDDRHDRHGFL